MILKGAAVGVLCAAVGAVLSELGFSGKRIFAASAITVILCAALSGASDMIGDILGIADGAGVGKIGRVALKVVGCGYLFGFVSDVCEELGERGIGSAVAVLGRVEMLALVFPYFLDICKLGASI